MKWPLNGLDKCGRCGNGYPKRAKLGIRKAPHLVNVKHGAHATPTTLALMSAGDILSRIQELSDEVPITDLRGEAATARTLREHLLAQAMEGRDCPHCNKPLGDGTLHLDRDTVQGLCKLLDVVVKASAAQTKREQSFSIEDLRRAIAAYEAAVMDEWRKATVELQGVALPEPGAFVAKVSARAREISASRAAGR